MGNMRRLPDNVDFGPEHFAQEKDFGFTGSSQGYDSKGSASPPFAASESTNNGENFQNYAEGGPVGGSAHTFSKGGAANGHPQGHQVVGVHHDPETGAIMHKHAHGGFTMHHPDGGISHHGADGQPAMAARGGDMNAQHPGEGTFLERSHGGKMPHHKAPMHKPAQASRGSEPDDTAPRDPMKNPSRRNAMPGGQMGYGVEPSAEPDDVSGNNGMPTTPMARGGHARGR